MMANAGRGKSDFFKKSDAEYIYYYLSRENLQEEKRAEFIANVFKKHKSPLEILQKVLESAEELKDKKKSVILDFNKRGFAAHENDKREYKVAKRVIQDIKVAVANYKLFECEKVDNTLST